MFFRYNICMNINQMKYVVVLAEEKSFTKAAKKLFISQPSLSKSIKLFNLVNFLNKNLQVIYLQFYFSDMFSVVL